MFAWSCIIVTPKLHHVKHVKSGLMTDYRGIRILEVVYWEDCNYVIGDIPLYSAFLEHPSEPGWYIIPCQYAHDDEFDARGPFADMDAAQAMLVLIAEKTEKD